MFFDNNTVLTKSQHYWNLTMRLFSVTSRTLIGESYPSAEVQSVYSTAPADWAMFEKELFWHLTVYKQKLYLYKNE